jgi:mono/diheme cytochrome c family protein
MTLRGTVTGTLAAIALLAGAATARAQSTPPAPAADRAAYVFAAAGCAECHTVKGGKPLAGGRALKTPFGIFYSPNITPDPGTGIGKWTEANLRRALREGRGPDGTHYYPVFPYPSFTFMTDEDIGAVYAYLMRQPPVVQANKRHEIKFPYRIRATMIVWNDLYLERGPLRPDPRRPAAWNRGAYLVRALGHCGECHTPRNRLGSLDLDDMLSGTNDGPEGDPVPNITPDRETGIGGWSDKDIEYLLETGQKPDGDSVGGAMGAVVDLSTSKLTAEDRAAITSYLKSLPPIRHQVRKAKAKG